MNLSRNFLAAILMATMSVSLISCTKSEETNKRPTFTDPGQGGGGNNGCVSIDTDGDGLLDCQDPDIDNDGVLNADDAFPRDPTEWEDSDGDGVGDNSDWAPFDATEWADRDGDNIGDNADPDDDNDGVPDRWDSLPYNNLEQLDTDLDGIGNNADPDDDNDGVPDQWDDLFYKQGGFDIDHDFDPNITDLDIDGDGVLNEVDAFPWDNTETKDSDFDEIGDNKDPDDDNDGVPDVFDDFPFQNNRKFDWDKDGYANEDDAFPYNPTEWIDSDGDGYGDNSDAFPSNPFEWKDTDNDGIGDNSDVDADGDGYLNQVPAFETLQLSCFVPKTIDSCQAVSGCSWVNARCVPATSCLAFTTPANCSTMAGCTWQGTYCEQDDYFPLDLLDNFDSDLDGVGDNRDPDDDNDGIPDIWDEFPTRKESFIDYDADGLYDISLPTSFGTPCHINPLDFDCLPPGQAGFLTDPDTDNDGVPDFWDDLRRDSQEIFDFDGDGIGDNLDLDDDNDGFFDAIDKFPKDPTEWFNYDELFACSNPPSNMCSDNVGDNADQDDDNDGVPDQWDDFPYQSGNAVDGTVLVPALWDVDGDGSFDQADTDIDGDNFNNGLDDDQKFNITCTTQTGVIKCGFQNNDARDKFPWDKTEWEDSDSDGIGNNADPDDDNDGVPDQWDDNDISATVRFDIDGDGLDNSVDPDIDGDGLNITDDDSDGVADDLFPWDREDWADNDADGIGDNRDQDDDNDGVPDAWDDLPLDERDWLDIDGDGIGNSLDLYTPNGIRSEADIAIAIARNETNWGITADFTTTACINIPLEKVRIFSVTNLQTLTYGGPDGGNMFCVNNNGIEISKVKIIIPKTKNNVTVVSSTTNRKNFIFAGIELVMEKAFKIANLKATTAKFYKNNILYTINDQLTPAQSSLISLDFDANTDVTTSYFMGNIVYIDIKTTQVNPFSLIRMAKNFHRIQVQNNVIYVKKAPAVTMPFSSIFDLGFNSSLTESLMTVTENRVNLDITGKLFNVAGTPDANKMNAADNKVHGITELGNANLNQNPIMREPVDCAAILEQGSCSQNVRCVYNVTTAACEANPVPILSYAAYYDFKDSDIWLAPDRKLYFMFYPPFTTELANSPAIYGFSIFSDGYPVVSEATLGENQPSVFYVGVYGPIMDSDADRYPDEIDVFIFNPNEWIDTDLDGIGNNSDSDDDNDNLLDVYEHSRCQNIVEESACAAAQCSWDDEVHACKRNSTPYGCQVAGSTWDQAQRCCILASVCVDGTDPFTQDTDGDGLSDYEELYTYMTNPILRDTDGDGDGDGEEISNGTDPLDPLSSKDTDQDGLTDNYEIENLLPLGCVDPQNKVDSDGDGVNDFDEVFVYATSPCLADSDSDGISDFDEIFTYLTNPNLVDSDGDGRSDFEELFDVDVTKRSDPTKFDTDGDGASDGQEILDGTNPTSAVSFKDTDEDGESDYVDLTPFGVVPCTNSNLAGCAGPFTAAQIRTEFLQQWTAANGCVGHLNQTACGNALKGMCKWNAAISKCEAKSINIYQDLELTNCSSVSVGSNVTIRSARANQRRSIIATSSTLGAGACSNFTAATTSTVSTIGPLHILNNAKLSLSNVRLEGQLGIPAFITSSNVGGGVGQSLQMNSVEMFMQEQNGPVAITLNNPVSLDLEKTTIRASLHTTTPTQASVRSALRISNATSVNIRGSVIDCNTQDKLAGLVSANRAYECVQLMSSNTVLDGNVFILRDIDGLTPAQFVDAGNNIYNLKLSQNLGPMEVRNSRFYSHAKTLNVDNGGATVNFENVRSRAGDDSNNITWNGPSTPTTASLPSNVVYGNVFENTFGANFKCIIGNNADFAVIHPAYFSTSPTRSFWTIMSRPSYSDVQVPGAGKILGGLCSP